MLRRAGVDTTRVLRTGGVAALTYGEATIGVPPSLLLAQRRAVAAAAAPASGLAGQNLDLALLLADGSAKGKVDPAYEAHAAPIRHWAQAVWNRWLPIKSLVLLIADAKANLAKAIQPWRVAYGPAAAFVCTASRLDWIVHDALNVTTDAGRTLRLDVDPPVIVARECDESVRRWRWRSIENVHHSLDSGGAGLGATMGPIWKLLRSRENSSSWNPGLRGALRSAIANRQWPQERCFKAGFVAHPKCIFCVYAATDPAPVAWGPAGIPPPTAEPTQLPPPTQADIEAAPVGTRQHRIWQCPRLGSSRNKLAPAALRLSAAAADAGGDVMLERALFPSLAAEVPPPREDATFYWTILPPGGSFRGTVYSDGSRLGGPSRLLARNGWAFVVMDLEGKIIAAANGVTPRWVDDIPGAEAWALTQAASRAEPGCEYRVDCEACVKAVHRGPKWATSDRRPHARVHALMHSTLGDTPAETVVWMPAHKGEADIGVARLGNGSYLSQRDVEGNAEADSLAKLAVEEHRVPKTIVTKLRKQDLLAGATAKWIAMATFEAGHQTVRPFRDSEASRGAAVAAAKLRKNAAQRPPTRVTTSVTRPLALGGHDLRRHGGIWECRTCKRTSKMRCKLAPRRCEGSVVRKWVDGWGHTRVMSGEVIWCTRCGSYAESAAKGLAKPCRGRFQGSLVRGGLAGQLKTLMAGRHPATRAALPPPVPEHKWQGRSGPFAHIADVSRPTDEPRGSGEFAALRERIRAMESPSGVTTVGASTTDQLGKAAYHGEAQRRGGCCRWYYLWFWPA